MGSTYSIRYMPCLSSADGNTCTSPIGRLPARPWTLSSVYQWRHLRVLVVVHSLSDDAGRVHRWVREVFSGNGTRDRYGQATRLGSSFFALFCGRMPVYIVCCPVLLLRVPLDTCVDQPSRTGCRHSTTTLSASYGLQSRDKRPRCSGVSLPWRSAPPPT